MNTPTQAQPQIQPKAEQNPSVSGQSTAPVQPVKKSTTPLILGICILTLIIIGLLGYILLTGPMGKQQATTALPTPTELPMPTTNTIQPTTTSAALSPTLFITATIKPKPTIAPNPDGNTFTSDTMGISFYYANKTPADSTGSVKVLESGSIVYVYISSGKPENGQSIERFAKSPADTLAQAISKRFLAGIPAADCFVKIDPKKPSPTMTRATIGYPVPANADKPNFEYGEKCPEKYKESNGMAFFMEDSKSPDRFYWVSIGQYGIPAYDTKPDSLWQDTIVVY